MRCPYCRSRDSKVTDSRATGDGIRRRRQCVVCGERFTTLEAIQLSTVQVVKKDGRREDFNREKLLAGLRKACSKRNISVAQLEAMVAEIEARLSLDGRAEVPSSFVGEVAMDLLRKADHIAYIRFASVYRPFTDLASLKEALQALEEGRVASIEEQTLQLALPTLPDGRPLRPRLLPGLDRTAATPPQAEVAR
ncbi:MAG: transcriptional repressor NrdR [Dehalococcoidia bacterium]|nr:transcriptional repressor NrdR [Dehalococcoidia bacterium]